MGLGLVRDVRRKDATGDAGAFSHLARRPPTSAIWLLLVEVADFPMMRKCLLGIKRRAESLASGRVASTEWHELHRPVRPPRELKPPNEQEDKG